MVQFDSVEVFQTPGRGSINNNVSTPAVPEHHPTSRRRAAVPPLPHTAALAIPGGLKCTWL